MITVEFNENLDAVELHLDKAEIEKLISQLESLKSYDSHIHPMTPAWGGEELADGAHGANKLVNHLIIYSHQA